MLVFTTIKRRRKTRPGRAIRSVYSTMSAEAQNSNERESNGDDDGYVQEKMIKYDKCAYSKYTLCRSGQPGWHSKISWTSNERLHGWYMNNFSAGTKVIWGSLSWNGVWANVPGKQFSQSSEAQIRVHSYTSSPEINVTSHQRHASWVAFMLPREISSYCASQVANSSGREVLSGAGTKKMPCSRLMV